VLTIFFKSKKVGGHAKFIIGRRQRADRPYRLGRRVEPARQPAGDGAAGVVHHHRGCRDRDRGKPKPWYLDHAVFNASWDSLKAMTESKYTM
jgi:hypothetical protein